MKPGRQRLLIPGLLVALLVVVAVVAGIRQAQAAPTPAPPPVPTPVPTIPVTPVSEIDDPRITESSGLAASQTHPGIAYTVNDSGHDPQVFAIDIASGRVVGVTKATGVQWRDTEAIGLWGGKLWVADVGNNNLSRDDAALYLLDEPGPGDQVVTPTRYPLTFDGPAADAEAMSIVAGRVDFYLKGWPASYAVELTGQLKADEPNVARKTMRTTLPFATDATATPDGRYVLVRNTAVVEVMETASWRVVHRDAIPVMNRGETITVEPSGRSYLIGTEGANSPLLRVAFEPETWAGKPIPHVDTLAQTRAEQPVRLFVWEHRWQLGGAAALVVLAGVGLLVGWRRRVRRRSAGESKEKR